ncbi:MAG TPA: hypothetical protein VNI77_12320 [Nitrososphaera sp.]|nr:hypothetical protein [Nitrososphaera sp.]
MYVNAYKESRRVQNIRSNPDRVYYSINDENLAYEGVKGSAQAIIIEDTQRNISIPEKINLKYFGTLEHPIARELIEKPETQHLAESKLCLVSSLPEIW